MHPQGVAIPFTYCERGIDPAFWAEPLNAVTNAGFIVAAFVGMAMIANLPSHQRSLWHVFFVINFLAIGVGSFLFHTMPSIQTAAADTGPIGIFMLAYLIFAMRRFVGASWFLTLAALAAFIGLMVIAFNLQCWDGRIGFVLENVPIGARAKCLNGSLGYAPAFAAIAIMAGWLSARRHMSAPMLFAAAITFAVSLAFRSLDQRLCGDFMLMGHRVGTHFIWHLLNSLTLFILLAAAIKYGSAQQVLPPRPKAQPPVYAAS